MEDIPGHLVTPLAEERVGAEAFAVIGVSGNTGLFPIATHCVAIGRRWTATASCPAEGGGALCGWAYLCDRVSEGTTEVLVEWSGETHACAVVDGWFAFVTKSGNQPTLLPRLIAADINSGEES